MAIQYKKEGNRLMRLFVNGVFISTMIPKETDFLKTYGADIAKAEILKAVELLRQEYKDLNKAKKNGEIKNNETETVEQLIKAIVDKGKQFDSLLKQIQ